MTTDTAPAELVTEEMVSEAIRVYRADERIDKCLGKVLRAVAPLIAARVRLEVLEANAGTCVAAIAKEREACAKIVEGFERYAFVTDQIAAAIRARGEAQ